MHRISVRSGRLAGRGARFGRVYRLKYTAPAIVRNADVERLVLSNHRVGQESVSALK
jgi:hypothetical protein